MTALRKLLRVEPVTYTPNEASLITGIPIKQVYQYMDRDLTDAGLPSAGAKRHLTELALFGLRLAFDFASTLSAETRCFVLKCALESSSSKKTITLDDGKVVVRIDTARAKVRSGLALLKQVRSTIVSKPEILSGEPCIRGTRISAYTAAAVMESDGLEAALRAYPSLNAKQLEAAAAYATTYPRRGRPKSLEATLKRSQAKPRSRKVVSL